MNSNGEGQADDVVVARSRAYDDHYRTLWHSRRFTLADLQDALGDFLVREQGGNINGNEIQFALKQAGVPDMRGKVVLDYCCGTGMTAIYFALLGATVIAFDRSHAAVAIARESVAKSGVSDRVHLFVIDARHLPFTDATFDVSFCQSALHIVAEYEECAPELARVLRPGGRAVFCEEALRYNPIVEALRYLLRRKYAGCGGHPVTYEEIRRFGQPFQRTGVDHFNLTLQIKTLFGSRIGSRGVRRFLRSLAAFDRWTLSVAPWLKPLCGKVVVTFEGPIPGRSGGASKTSD